jgi:iron(III) transport system ATP-binding protein
VLEWNIEEMVGIRIEQLVKRFGQVLVLDRIDLEIHPGELFFLLGPSGCGKTTLLRHIAGFYTPSEGRIFLGKEDVTHKPAHKRNTAMMFQSYALWPHMTVAKNVAFGLEERGVEKFEIGDRVDQALGIVKMADYGGRKINELSGGQQQRVALARSLVVRPQCLLLDEPLSNLDAKLRLEMRAEIRRITKEFGLTAVYVTHDQKEALSMADRMAVMDQGKVAQVGTPAEVYRHPSTRRVADFIGETNFLEGVVVRDTSRPGQWDIDTALGRQRGSVLPGESVVPGQRVVMSVRPEALAISDLREGFFCVSGHIIDVTYLGEMAQYVVHLANGEVLTVAELNPRFLRSRGDHTVYVVANPADVVLLSE